MKKNLLAKIFVTLVLAAVVAVSANAEFAKTQTYNNQFTDVKAGSWYENEVKSAYELGFMNGTSDTVFSPSGNVTVAQGVTMAARINATSEGKTIDTVSGGKWYDGYVKYAIENGIMAQDDFDSYDRPIKRHEMTTLIYNSADRKNFKAQNNVLAIPDVSNAAEYKDELLVLYNAGIVMGSDDYGKFNPDANITRAECSAIINRVALPENRLKKELKFESSMQAYIVVENVEYTSSREGINSGWVYDNRGGSLKKSIEDVNYRILDDNSDKYGVALIREFNQINRGTVTVETSANISNNGASLMFHDKNGNVAYELKALDKCWKVRLPDGSYNILSEDIFANGKDFTFKIVVDFGKKLVTTYINDEELGETMLLSDNILNFRFATDEPSRVKVTPGTFLMTANYAVYDDFDRLDAESVYGWSLNGAQTVAEKRSLGQGGATTKDGELVLGANGTAVKNFEGISGKVSAQTYFILPNGGDASIKVGKLNVEAKGGKLYANGSEIYKSVTANMWYRLKADIDTVTGNATVYLNGRKVGEVAGVTGNISAISFSAAANVKIDNVRVYKLVDEGEYVPVPTTKANIEEGYVVGMDICSLWKNGEHRGWACITPYDEPKTVLGYYDEGNTELADWEIKYMVEHGVDFQSFCWFNEGNVGPVKEPRYSDALHEGYMYAQYSDYMKYSLLWEVASGNQFDMDKFKYEIVPYWFENYFLDDRYLVLDNQIMLFVFGQDTLTDARFLGSVAAAKEAFDYLDEVAQMYGFDGVIALGSNGESVRIASMGMEGQYSYTHGHIGNTVDGNIESIQSHATSQAVYYVPTSSTGFDEMAWAGERYGNISAEDFDKVNEWIRDEYLPTHHTEGTWNENLVIFDTWNEYGEGHYIMPTQEFGFMYLDSIKKYFGDEGVVSEQILPTASQTDRFNHMYPQYARLLRRDGWYDGEAGEAKLFINDVEFASENPSVNKDGMLLFPYDSGIGEDLMLSAFVTWRSDVGTLKLEANGHVVEFEVDSSVYYVDGIEKELGYKLYMQNGLPVVSFKALALGLGYKYTEEDGNAYVYTEHYDFSSMNKEKAEFGTWEFNGIDSEGWVSSSMMLSTSSGSLTATSLKPEDYNPVISLGEFVPFAARKYKGMEFKIKYDYTTKSGNPHSLVMYIATDKATSLSETNSFYTKLNSLKTDEFETYYVDFTTESGSVKWNNMITAIRLDPFDGNGTMEFDYIKLIPNPDYVEVDAETGPFVISNPDAEAGVKDQILEAPKPAVDYHSTTAKISVISEPKNENNHVLKVEASITDRPCWAYLRQSVYYKENHRYKYSYDVYYVDNVDGTGDAVASCFTNFVYTDLVGDSDHSINNGEVKKGKWTTIKGEFVVNEFVKGMSQEFTMFLAPTNDRGCIFYVDNIVVTEVPLEESEIVKSETIELPQGSIDIPALANAGMLTDCTPFSNNARITWLEEDNAYLVVSNPGKMWGYFRVSTEFEKDAEYAYSYEIKLLSDTNGLVVGASQAWTNFVYMDDQDNSDNTDSIRPEVKSGGDWVRVGGIFSTSDLVNNMDNQFSVFVPPIGEVGPVYEIRKIVVEKIS